MANKEAHSALAKELLAQMRRSQSSTEWAIAVDAGFYAVFHSLEALNATECRDSYSFADAADILENVLVGRVLDKSVLKDYRHLFYFRRGALYGCHVPNDAQLAEYCKTAERCFARVAAKLEVHAEGSAA